MREKELFDDLISQGISLMTKESYESAKDCFMKAIEVDMRSAEAYVHLGNAYANLQQFDDAMDAFKKALILKPESGDILFAMGNIYLLKEERLKAIELFNQAEQAGYKTADMYQIMAMVFLDVNDTAQALRNITRAIAVAPLDGTLRLFKARLYLIDNRYDEALDTLDEMAKVLPDAFEAYDLRGQILCGMKKYEQALKVCEDGCSRFPEDADLALCKLKVLVESDRIEDAETFLAKMKQEKLYERVLKMAAMQEVTILLKRVKVEEALMLLAETNRKLGGDADVLYLLLDLQGKAGKLDDALKTAEELLTYDINVLYKSTALYFRAFAMDKQGKKTEAKKEFKKLTKVFRKYTIEDPGFYEGYIFRLLCHTNLGEYAQALELADYLENMYPERGDGNAFRHFIYKEMGDMDKANQEKEKAQALNPKFIM